MAFDDPWHREIRRKEQERRAKGGLPPATERELRRIFRASNRAYSQQIAGRLFAPGGEDATTAQLRKENEALRTQLNKQSGYDDVPRQ